MAKRAAASRVSHCAEAGGAGAGGSGAGGARAGGAGAGDTGAVDPGAGGVGAGGAVSGDSFTARREPESRPASPVRAVHTGRHVPRPRPPPVPGTHAMALRPSSVPLHVPLLPPPESSLPSVPDPESDLARAASPTVSRLLATFVTDPCFQTTAASSLVAELVDFAAACRLDYATALVAESESAGPLSIGGECALGKDVHEDRQEDLECLAAAVPHLVAMFLALEGDPDAPDIPTPRSYAEAITVLSSGANIVDGNWIFRMKRPPGSLPSFKARYVARGFSQPQGVDYFQTFSPTPKMTTLRVLLHVAAQRDYELHSLDFSTAFLQGSLHEEIWLRRPPGFTRSFPVGTLWSLRRPVYSLRQAPHEWHDTLRTTLAALGFAPSTADPSLFLRTETSLPPFYVLVYVDVLIFATTDTEALALVMSELPKRHTCTDQGELRNYLGLQINRDRARRTITLTQSHMVHQVLQRFGFCTSGMGLLLGGRGLVVLTGHADASWVDDLATQRSSQSYTFSLAVAGSRPKDVDKMKSAKDSGRGEIRRRECWQCGNPDHLSFECPGRSDFDDDYAKGGYGRSGSRRPRRGKNQPRKEKQSTKSSTSAKDANSSAGGKGRDDKEASCSLVGIVKPTVSLAPEAGEDF
ncbi:unnamed protein product [Closterium sp. NIES-54]